MSQSEIIEYVKSEMSKNPELVKMMEKVKSFSSLNEMISNSGTLTVVFQNLIKICSTLKEKTQEEKINAISVYLDDQISLPWYLEPFDEKIIKLLLTLIFDTVSGKYKVS